MTWPACRGCVFVACVRYLLMKKCRGCSRDLPLLEFSRHKRSADGLQARCRDCNSAYHTARRQRIKAEGHTLPHDDGKRCSRCKAFRSWSEFHRNASVRDGHQSQCKPCSANTQREYVQRNAEAVALRQAEKLATAVPPNTTKTCTKCKTEKPALSFYAHRGTKDGRATYCAECQRAATRAWTAANAERVRERNAAYRTDPAKKRRIAQNMRSSWLRLYGLTESDYNRMLDEQSGVCAICLKPESFIDARTGEARRLAVDHCHDTGKVRGLLCGRCNRTLGHLNEDVATFERAATYLRQARDA